MILRYQFYSLCSKWSFYSGVTHELSQCRCDSSNPFSNNWILPLITLASTLREFQCDSPDPHCKYLHFLIDHIRLQVSSFKSFFEQVLLGNVNVAFQTLQHKGHLFPSFTPFQSSCERPNVLLPNVSPKIYIIVLIALVNIFSFGICWSLGGGAISKKVIYQWLWSRMSTSISLWSASMCFVKFFF